MSSGRRTVTVFLAVISGLVLGILSLVQRWPLWIWPASLAALAGAAWLLGKALAPRPDPFAREYAPEPDLPIPPPERRAQDVQEVAVASSLPDYDFLFSATVRWCPLPAPSHAPVVSPAGLAVSAVLERAEALTKKLPPHRSSLAQHQLNGALGTMLSDPTGRVEVMAENVALTLAEADSQRLTRLSTVRKEEAVWEHERKHECDKRAYLGEDVLKNTGSAVVWWLARNEDQIKRAVDDIGVLAQLSSAANNDDVPERFQHMVPFPVPQPDPEPEPVPAGHFGNGFFDGAPGNNGHATASTSTSASTSASAHDEPAPPPSAADLFNDLLTHVGVPSEDGRTAVLARNFGEALHAMGEAEAAQEILDRFDFPAAPDDAPGNGNDDEKDNENDEEDAGW
ncbi:MULTISPECIES: hypothetical protein [unclassified Streptomyces]|uniref:hypothetical protein n=1 Tax=unclassified Streptomyces TaxID=2593676 RepID=UPI002DD89319|nr:MULTISPECIES: hypothetical protein [unclassified Streptomyces]WSB80761.1 hypothetical protein OHB04_36995 [Streptomyces sp. NBC_01775]WSS11030.1 hypothetical protein OG533_03255 [Streptomyces sp. NBC_01186]WSS39738.1 hypothetical protein OG220_03350 [Streptomyces sp. NBC_01187]